MMSDQNQNIACAVCVLLGAVLPWALLIFAALMSVIGIASEAAACMAAVGIMLLTGSYVLMRLVNMLAAR